MATAKKVYNEPKQATTEKPKKVYQDKKVGWIDRLTIYFAKRMDAASSNEFPPATNIRRLFGYLIDFFLSNILACVPLVFIESVVNGNVNTTQDLRIVPLSVAYVIVGCALLLYLFYFVYVPLKIWPGQTPGKRLLGYKMVMMDNSDVTLKALLIRNGLVLIFFEGAAMFITSYILQIFFLTIGFESVPSWIPTAYYFTTIFSVMVTMTNPCRRMVHDLASGTKVYKLDETQDHYSTF